MSCCGQREKGHVQEYHKWDYITLSDFKSSGCTTALSYIWLWFLAIVAVAVYGLDTFTAVNLLAFNKWSSQVQPAIPLDISKWIFSGCIILSWVLCFYEWMRALRVMKRGSVADDYMDPLAVKLQSLRATNGYRKFVVFAKLTDSKRGNDYVALFAYFQFKGMIRVLLAEGPRQVINAITLVSVAQAQIFDHGQSGFSKLWANIQALAEQNNQQVVILFSMLFTLVIWIFSVTSLLLAFILYLTFLWHFIPVEDGTIAQYCRRKIEKRLEKAVSKNYQAMLQREEAKRKKAERDAAKYGQKMAPLERRPTLPALPGSATPSLSRQTTETLPPYPGSLSRTTTAASARTVASPSDERKPSLPNMPGTSSPAQERGPQPTLPQIDGEPTLPNLSGGLESPSLARTMTQNSTGSTRTMSDAPLVASASAMGYSNAATTAPSHPPRSASAQPAPPVSSAVAATGVYPTYGKQQLPPRSATAAPRALPPAAVGARQPGVPPPRSMTAPIPPRGYYENQDAPQWPEQGNNTHVAQQTWVNQANPPRDAYSMGGGPRDHYGGGVNPSRNDYGRGPRNDYSSNVHWPHPAPVQSYATGVEAYEMQPRPPQPTTSKRLPANAPPIAAVYPPAAYQPPSHEPAAYQPARYQPAPTQTDTTNQHQGHGWHGPDRFDQGARWTESPGPMASRPPRSGTAAPPSQYVHGDGARMPRTGPAPRRAGTADNGIGGGSSFQPPPRTQASRSGPGSQNVSQAAGRYYQAAGQYRG